MPRSSPHDQLLAALEQFPSDRILAAARQSGVGKTALKNVLAHLEGKQAAGVGFGIWVP